MFGTACPLFSCIARNAAPQSQHPVVGLWDTGAFQRRNKKTGWQLYKAAVIQADALHQFDSCGGLHLLPYLDAESAMAINLQQRQLNRRYIAAMDVNIGEFVKPGRLESCLANTNPDVMCRLVQQFLQHLTGLQ